jgi:hypothetical protein
MTRILRSVARTVALVLCATTSFSQREAALSKTQSVSNAKDGVPAQLPCRAPNKKHEGPPRPAGVIQDVQGPECFYQFGDSRPVQLRRGGAKLKTVFIDDKLYCRGQSSLVVQFGGNTDCGKPSENTNCGKPTTTVLPSDCLTVPEVGITRSDAIGIALRGYNGRAAGEPRGEATPFYSPAPKSYVRAADLVFRWTPDTIGEVFSLSILDANGHTIWAQDGITGATGELASPEARERLLKYRDETGEGTFELFSEDSNGRTSRFSFRLLSPASEGQLTAQLAKCAEAADAMQHLCRAAIFGDFGLLNEVAREYDQALRFAPDSQDLLSAAAAAHVRIGDITRGRDLRRRISQAP